MAEIYEYFISHWVINLLDCFLAWDSEDGDIFFVDVIKFCIKIEFIFYNGFSYNTCFLSQTIKEFLRNLVKFEKKIKFPHISQSDKILIYATL
jgi:hypothetical protein